MTQHLDDIELIRQFRERDHEVFEQLVAEYRDELVRHARRKLGDDGSAEDAVQETFLRAYRSSHRLRDDSRLRPWLHQILANVCIDEANRRQRQRFLTDKVERDPSVNVTYSIEEELRLDVDAGPVRKALDSLPPTHQQAFVMRFVDDLGYDEIAHVAGTSEQNVRARVSRARTVLRAAYRGAAAVPLFVAGAMRRGRTAAAAADKAQTIETVDRISKVEQATRAATVTAEGASGVTRIAASMAPAMETATTVAMSAQASAPTIGKAAAGIGALALAAMSTGSSEVPQRVVAPPAVEIAAETEAEAEVLLAPEPEPTPEPVVAEPAPTAPPTPEPAPVIESAPEPRLATSVVIDESDTALSTIAPTPTTEPSATTTPTTAAPAPAPEPTVAETPPVEEIVEPEITDPVDGIVDDGAIDDAPADDAPPTDEVPQAEEAPPAPVLSGGTISVGGLTLTPAGPRFDLAGSASMSIGGASLSGPLSGRFGLTDPDADGRRRLDGVVTVTVAGSPVEIRLAGHATPLDGDAETPATSFSISGQFRTNGGAVVSLVERGGFSGSFAPGNLSLSLTP